MTAASLHSLPVRVAAIVGIIVASVAVIHAVRLAWSMRERRRKPEPSADWCATCLRDLARGDVWEVREDERPFVGDDPSEVGATYLAMTYCRRHKPKGAVRT